MFRCLHTECNNDNENGQCHLLSTAEETVSIHLSAKSTPTQNHVRKLETSGDTVLNTPVMTAAWRLSPQQQCRAIHNTAHTYHRTTQLALAHHQIFAAMCHPTTPTDWPCIPCHMSKSHVTRNFRLIHLHAAYRWSEKATAVLQLQHSDHH